MSDAPPRRYLIGVDGGGTGTRARLTSSHGVVLGIGRAGPSALGQGTAQAWRHVHDAVAEAFRAAGLAPQATALDAPAFLAQCDIGLGLSGAENPGWVSDFLACAPGWGRIALDTDAHAALLGAHGGGPGALVTVGTGSVGQALFADGRRRTVGGWGWTLGDEGGGAWLGQHAVRHAQHTLDGRTPEALAAGSLSGAGPSLLARAIWARCGSDRASLLDWCAAADQTIYAALSPLVFDLEHRDPAAAALIAAAVEAVQALALALDPPGDLPLVIAGSIGQQLAARLPAALRERLVDPLGDATDGALRLLTNTLSRPATGEAA